MNKTRHKTVLRKYQMTRVRAGSYLLPSNDAKTLWHIYSFVDGKSAGLDEPDRTWWACAKFNGSFERGVESAARDVEDYGHIDWNNWQETDSYLKTRAEAIEAALKAS